MAFDFPSAPTAGDEYTSGGVTYVWDGLVWNLKGGGELSDYVLKIGDTMTGALNMSGAGVSFGTNLGANADDLTKGIEMYSGANGMGICTTTGGQFNFSTKHADHAFNFRTGAALRTKIDKNGLWCPGWIKANTGANGGFLIGDQFHGWVWQDNAEHLRSYQGVWEFRKTNGSVPGTKMNWIDGNTHGRLAGVTPANATVTPAVGAFRPGCNIILYNDSIVTWHCTWESGFPTAESTWTTVVNASGYPSNLRPSHKLEQWSAMSDSTGNATSVGLGFELNTDGVIKVWKPKDGPDIKAGIVAHISFVYPRNT